ncbi:hypothetical protein KR054_005759, partial [Drosophila jambulina]
NMSVIKYARNLLDDEFDYLWKKVSCYAANAVPFEERCEFVEKAESCITSSNVVPYMSILACDLKVVNKFQEGLFLTLIVVFCIEIVFLLSYVCYSFYTPALKAVAKYLHMNEHLAGVTLLAFGTTSGDLFSNLANIKKDIPVVGNIMSSALFVVLISGGLISYLTPYKMDGYESGRDLLYLILGASLLDLYISNDGAIDVMESFIMSMVYISYIVINVLDVVLLRMTLRCKWNVSEIKLSITYLHILAAIDGQIAALMDGPVTPDVDIKLMNLEELRRIYSEDSRVDIYERRSLATTNTRIQFATMRMIGRPRKGVNRRRTKYAYFDITADPNRGLFRQFFLGLRPIKCRQWRKAEMIKRTNLLVQAPAVLLCHIFIPVVDCELKKHGWNKLLNCIQIMLNPAVSIAVIAGLFRSRDRVTLWYTQLHHTYVYGMYSLIVTLPLAVFVFCTSRTDLPPRYHWAFTAFSLTGSMTMILLCATEIDTAIEVIGHIIHVDTDFMGATVQACTANLGALFANTAMARDGYPKMAYASAIGGPMLSILFSASTLLKIRELVNGGTQDTRSQWGTYGQMAYVFLIVALVSSILWATTLGFFARRCVGLFSILVYLIYVSFAILVNLEVVHSYSLDTQLRAGFGDI